MNIDESLSATIRTLGLSRIGFWWVKTFGSTVENTTVGENDVTYIEWRDQLYVSVQRRTDQGEQR